jgi:hypothetical protein
VQHCHSEELYSGHMRFRHPPRRGGKSKYQARLCHKYVKITMPGKHIKNKTCEIKLTLETTIKKVKETTRQLESDSEYSH